MVRRAHSGSCAGPSKSTSPTSTGRGATLRRRNVGASNGIGFGPRYVHDVRNAGPESATSIHAYSPPLRSMTYYRFGLRALTVAAHRATARAGLGTVSGTAARARVDEELERVRVGLHRIGPDEAAAVLEAGGLVVDIRPAAQRAASGRSPVPS